MAQKDDASPVEKKGGGLIKIVLILVIGIVLIGGSVGATLVLTGALTKKAEGEGGEGADSHGVPDKGPLKPVSPLRGPPIYHPLDPPFVVNFEEQGILRYLQVGLTVMTRDARVIDVINQNMPQIRNDLILLLSNQKMDVLLSLQGKEKLRMQVLAQIQGILNREVGIPGIEAVYFTAFILQ